jgi:hypothetical protein
MVTKDNNSSTKNNNNKANNECVDDNKALWEDDRDPNFQSAHRPITRQLSKASGLLE